jgi:hypothetical protein
MSTELAVGSPQRDLFDQRFITALGYAGTLPMLACVLAIESNWSVPLLEAYSLAIIAFLAGSWWSTALMRRGSDKGELLQILMLSNGIVLVAVVAATFLGNAALLILAGLFGCLLLGERTLSVFQKQPLYYRRMRTGATVCVIILHFAAFGLAL